MKPTPNNNKYPAALTNTEIKNNTEITGFFDVITNTPDNKAPNANKSNKNVFIITKIF